MAEDPCEGCVSAPTGCVGIDHCKIAKLDCTTCVNDETDICEQCCVSFCGIPFDRPSRWNCKKKTT